MVISVSRLESETAEEALKLPTPERVKFAVEKNAAGLKNEEMTVLASSTKALAGRFERR